VSRKSPGRVALEELAQKSLHEIQSETALKWAWRAWAALEHGRHAKGATRARWRSDANEYAHEALEHAALAEQGDGLLAEVREIVREAL
jgi:hypothetical protein